jgi:hypothetical protein
LYKDRARRVSDTAGFLAASAVLMFVTIDAIMPLYAARPSFVW